MSPDLPALRRYLDDHYRRFDYARFRQRDPVRFLEPFRGKDPRDVELAGFLASALAYGRVEIILDHVAQVMHRMGGEPFAYVRSFDPGQWRRDWTGFRHRFNDGRDMAHLIFALSTVIAAEGGMEAVVAPQPAGPPDPDVAAGLSRLIARLAAADPRPVFGARARALPASTRFLLSSPRAGSTCKRLFMFARWMVRSGDGVCPVDFGVWRRIAPSALVLPLDTHTGRLVRHLGLVGERRTLGLAMAREATAVLRELDPADPVKYDFALAHIGISGQCVHRRVREICSTCRLDPVCRL
jgi:uncharacterized protein (TIGR02757 family)